MLSQFYLKFWGVRGSFPCTNESHKIFGGNTSCIQIQCDDHLLIFDAGTGLRSLGLFLENTKKPIKADLLLSHTHLDHILGIPFFKPFFDQKHQFQIWAGHLYPEQKIKDVLARFMSEPFFPVPLDIFKAQLDYRDFKPGDMLHLSDQIKVKTAPLNHPNHAIAYRLEYKDKSICYVTDTEHKKENLDQHILDLIQETDFFIYDATYTDQEYPHYRNWGHSTWEEGFRLAEKANVKHYIIFHHDPSHDDHFMEKIAQATTLLTPKTIVAYEGLTFNL